MGEGLFQPMHLLLIVSMIAVYLVPGICLLLTIFRLFSIDKSLKAILAELKLQRRTGNDSSARL